MKGTVKLTGDLRPGDLTELHGRMTHFREHVLSRHIFSDVEIDEENQLVKFNSHYVDYATVTSLNQIFGEMLMTEKPCTAAVYTAEGRSSPAKYCAQRDQAEFAISGGSLQRRAVGYELTLEK